MSLLARHKSKADQRSVDMDVVFDFIKMHKCGVLTTVTNDNQPHASVIYYYVDQSLNIRFLTKRHTHKSKNIMYSNNVMFVVYDEVLQTVVTMTGQLKEIENEKETHDVFLNSLRASIQTAGNAIPPVVRLDAGEHVAYKLIPKEVRMKSYNRNGRTGTDQGYGNITLHF